MSSVTSHLFLAQSIANEEAVEEQERHYTYLHLFKTPQLRRISLLVGVVW